MSKKSKIILIDLDQTLIDTRKIKLHRRKILKQFGFSFGFVKSFDKKLIYNGIFRPTEYIKKMESKTDVQQRILNQFYKLLVKKAAYNFPGAKDFVKKLSKIYRLILLSYGDKGYQLLKFKQTGMETFFEGAIITENLHKEKDLLKFFKDHHANVLLLDDSLEVINAAKRRGIKAFRIKKGGKNRLYYEQLLKKILLTH